MGERVTHRWLAGLFRGLCVALVVMVGACKSSPRPSGYLTPVPAEGIRLLDKDHAPHWKETKGRDGIFSIQDEVLHIPGSFGGLKYVGYMGETFDDFQLHLEFRLTRGANSGVLFRTQPENPHETGPEVQVLDSYGKEPSRHSCGAIYDVVTPMFEMSLPAGQWNSYDITFRGTHLVVVMNGWKIIDTDFALMTMPIGKFKTPYAEFPRSGYLFLQDHHHEVWYRNIVVKRL